MADATIRDVARRAQVSVASVSRVLNGMANVSAATRDRVNEAISALGYVPHAAARSLSRARTGAIGVVLPDVHGEFFSEVMRGMDREASARGYVLLLSNMHGAHAESALKAMRGRVDGLVVMAPHLGADEVEQALPPRQPAVLLNAHGNVRSHSSFGIDNRRGVSDIIDHFRALGRERIVHIAGPVGNVDADERREAFEQAMRRGNPGEVPMVLQGDYGEDSGAKAARQLVELKVPVDAIFAANDMMAIGAMDELRAAGVAIPDKIAVAGFDDVPISRHLGLTTARVRIDELGADAVSRLIDIVEDGEDRTIKLLHPPELIVRASSMRQ
jgi:LacI family transcriptional regulator